MSDILVNIENVTKSFTPQGPPSLRAISAQIPYGEIVGLVGPDGAGKTTLIRLIAALLIPTQGSIQVEGKDTLHNAEFIHSFSAYMPQKFGLYEDLTVSQNLRLYADLRGVFSQEREEAFKKLLSFTGLFPFQDRLAKALSGGMRQKLGLACALIKKPTLLLLDEPSVGVDPLSRRELWSMVYSLLEEGISVVWSTAYLDEAERCHTVLLLNKGEMLYWGKPKPFTERMEGRVFLKKGNRGNQRGALREILEQEGVIDAVIQGDDIRVLTDGEKAGLLKGLEPVRPRFEDTFVTLLGGGPKEGSQLAAHRKSLQKEKRVVVSAQHLTKSFGSFTAVDQINLTISSGEVFGLLGPNGAGKSTIFKMLCGLLKPTSGTALINGLDLQKAPGPARAQIGYMAQKFSLYGQITVVQNLFFFSGIYNLKGKQQQEAVDRAITIFDLKNYLNTPADLLPLGYKQRLSLACATLHEPPLLFLDEPTSGVDPLMRREFWNHINGLVEKGVTVMVTTHFMDEAEYCDTIALIYGGKIINCDAPNTLKAQVRDAAHPNPTLEEAFIHLIEREKKGNL